MNTKQKWDRNIIKHFFRRRVKSPAYAQTQFVNKHCHMNNIFVRLVFQSCLRLFVHAVGVVFVRLYVFGMWERSY